MGGEPVNIIDNNNPTYLFRAVTVVFFKVLLYTLSSLIFTEVDRGPGLSSVKGRGSYNLLPHPTPSL